MGEQHRREVGPSEAIRAADSTKAARPQASRESDLFATQVAQFWREANMLMGYSAPRMRRS
jgi:hypothetical protein